MNSKFKLNGSGLSLSLLKIILIIQVLLIIYPIAFTISASFIRENSLSAVGTIPFSKPFSLMQFKRLFSETNYGHWYLNTLKVACMNTVITVFVCSFTGYIFSRFWFPFKKTVMASMLVLQMFPSFIGMVATYVILWKINALNTLWGLVLVYATGSIPYNAWLMKGYFDTVFKRYCGSGLYRRGNTIYGIHPSRCSYSTPTDCLPCAHKFHRPMDGLYLPSPCFEK